MTRRKVSMVVLSVVAVGLTAALWPRPRGYTYQGKTVKEWFEQDLASRLLNDYPSPDAAIAFVAMGTNTVPFLVNRATQELSTAWWDKWQKKLQLPAVE